MALRSIIEQTLLDTMYELPSQGNVKRVVVDENTIEGEGKPLLIYADEAGKAGKAGPRRSPRRPRSLIFQKPGPVTGFFPFLRPAGAFFFCLSFIGPPGS